MPPDPEQQSRHRLSEWRLNWETLAQDLECDLNGGFAALSALYEEVDAHNQKNTAEVGLPCHRGCAMCCHESVFLTPLEFLFAWKWVEANHPGSVRETIVNEGLRLYRENQATIEALHHWPHDDASGRLAVARTLRFACPLLDKGGSCQIYPARELLARLFGASFNAAGGVYGCHLVGQHLKNKTVTLLPAEETARRLRSLPLTTYRQVYPFYLQLFFGAPNR